MFGVWVPNQSARSMLSPALLYIIIPYFRCATHDLLNVTQTAQTYSVILSFFFCTAFFLGTRGYFHLSRLEFQSRSLQRTEWLWTHNNKEHFKYFGGVELKGITRMCSGNKQDKIIVHISYIYLIETKKQNSTLLRLY